MAEFAGPGDFRIDGSLIRDITFTGSCDLVLLGGACRIDNIAAQAIVTSTDALELTMRDTECGVTTLSVLCPGYMFIDIADSQLGECEITSGDTPTVGKIDNTTVNRLVVDNATEMDLDVFVPFPTLMENAITLDTVSNTNLDAQIGMAHDHGVYLNACTDVIVSGSIIDASLAGSNTYDCYHIVGGSRVEIANARVRTDLGFARYGINVVSGTQHIRKGNTYDPTADFGTASTADTGTGTVDANNVQLT